MPCYDERTSASWIQEREVEPLEKQVRMLRRRLNAATRAACEFGRFLNPIPDMKGISAETLRWYDQHCKEDQKRKERGKR